MPQGLGREDLKALYQTFGPAIHRRARALLGRDSDAWDATQEVFEKLLRAGPAFRGDARPMTWVYRITTNVCLNLLRARKAREPKEFPSPEASVDQGSVEAANLLEALSGQLDERAREVAVMHFVDELTQEEIAEVLGLSRKTIQRELEAIRQAAATLGGKTEASHG